MARNTLPWRMVRRTIVVMLSAFFVAVASIGAGVAHAAPQPPQSASSTGGFTVTHTANGVTFTNAKGDSLTILTNGALPASVSTVPAGKRGTPYITNQAGGTSCVTGGQQENFNYTLLGRTKTECNGPGVEIEIDIQADICTLNNWDDNIQQCVYGGGWQFYSSMNPYGCLGYPDLDLYCPSQNGWASSGAKYQPGAQAHGTMQINVAAWFPDSSYDSGMGFTTPYLYFA